MTIDINIEAGKVAGTLAGRLDTAASEQFGKDIQPLIDNADKEITLDFSRLDFISSSGLRHLLTLRKASMAKGGKVIISGVNADIKQVFNVTGFNTLFEFV